jgi:NAD(P)-dependent dehydrogenase (short-subunit alcohol dehydrogenase family)
MAAYAARIVSITSTAQQAIDFDDVMLERAEYQGTRAYAQSKLAQIMMTVDLAEELEGTGVTANAVHPAVYMATSMVLNRRAGLRRGGPPAVAGAHHAAHGAGIARARGEDVAT